MQLQTSKQAICAAVVAALVAACTTNPDGSTSIDHRLTGALVGAAVGCGIAKAAKKDCAAGAAIGAAAGFMVGWYFESKKIADARQINREYEQKRVAVPRNEIKPVAFNSTVDTAAPDSQGEREVQITSNTDLIGYGDNVPTVEQKYALYDENNKLLETKTEKLAAVDGAGRYQSKSKFKAPKGKSYRVETTLVSNGKDVKKNSYKVALLDEGQPLMLLAAR